MRLVYATRRSKLALAQSRAFVDTLRARLPDATFEELQVVTSGDVIQDRPLYEVGGKGLFVKEIEEALLDGRADFAVHSIKDVPAGLPPGLGIHCIPPRSSPFDVLIVRQALLGAAPFTLDQLPQGAKVGTSSLRRQIALHAVRPDLQLVPLRGNVDTRLGKLDSGDLDAIVLAEAGLLRLGLEGRVSARLTAELCLPAVGQGALGIESREGDARVAAALDLVHDALTARAVELERGILKALGADCKTPIAAFAELDFDEAALLGEFGLARLLDPHRDERAQRVRVRSWVADPDGSGRAQLDEVVDLPADDAAAEAQGRELGARLLAARGPEKLRQDPGIG